MRSLAALLSVVVVLAGTVAADAAERRGKKRQVQEQRRSTTVDHRGLCQRDNGRPLDSLNLNHRCDREEFWNSMRDRGGDRGQ